MQLFTKIRRCGMVASGKTIHQRKETVLETKYCGCKQLSTLMLKYLKTAQFTWLED